MEKHFFILLLPSLLLHKGLPYVGSKWGVVLMLAVIMVQILVHGLVLAYGVMLPKIMRRFRASVTETGLFCFLEVEI